MLGDFLYGLSQASRPPSTVVASELIEQFYELPGNLSGGSLHIVLDDGNWEREHVQFCLGYAIEHGDVAGERLAELLLTLGDEDLRLLLGPPFCRRCRRDISENPLHEYRCRCPEGPEVESDG